jgi:acetate kinase
LKGLSGLSNDVRELEASRDPQARFALDYFVYRVALNAGLLAAALGGLDAFVFTAGIGENSPSLRARIVEKLAWLGGALDPQANAAAVTSIAARDSRIGLYIVPTDEELMIARHTLALLTVGGAECPSPSVFPDTAQTETTRLSAGRGARSAWREPNEIKNQGEKP